MNISLSDLKSIVCRKVIIPKKNGGSVKGIPKEYLNDVINDMCRYKLIERCNNVKFLVLENDEATARLRKFPF